MSMTQDTIERLRAKGEHFIWSLEQNSDDMRRFGDGDIRAETLRTGISGYLHGLRDCGVISENERRVLYNYYATVRGTVNSEEK